MSFPDDKIDLQRVKQYFFIAKLGHKIRKLGMLIAIVNLVKNLFACLKRSNTLRVGEKGKNAILLKPFQFDGHAQKF